MIFYQKGGIFLEPSTAKFRKAVRKAEPIIALISAYMTGIVDCLYSPALRGHFNFFNTIRAFFTTKLTLVLFPLFFILFGAIAVYFLHKSWATGALDDRLGREFKLSKSGSPYGDSQFEEPYEYKEVAQIRPISECKGKVLGQLTDDGSECIDFNPYDGRLNQHMLAIGASGGGKTFTFVKSYIFQSVRTRHSLVITDPDGGLYEDMSGYLRDNGYVVRQFNLKDLRKSDGWHMLKTLQGENMLTKVKIFAQTIVSNISNDNNIYSSGSNSLLCALLLKVLLSPAYPEEKKTIKSVYELLQNPAGYSFLETQFDKNTMCDEERPALAPYMAFKQASTNLAANIATHLANGLQLFQDPLLCDVLSTDDIDLTLPGRVPCAYFCQFPDSHNTFQFVVSLFFSMLFMSLSDYADLETPKRRLDVPVDFLMDEFPSVGIIPEWSTKISVLRKRNINCVMIIQDITQIQQRYLETWHTIVGNCGTIITLGINEPEATAKWLATRIGDTSIEVRSTTESQVGGMNRTPLVTRTSVGTGKRALMSIPDICKICRDDSMIIWAGHDPVYVGRFSHDLFPEAKNLYVTKPNDVLNIDDIEGRKLLRECEDSYRAKFWEEHRMFPDLNLSDMSNAMYTEPPRSPIYTLTEMLVEDISQLKRLVRKLVRVAKHLPEENEPSVEPDDRAQYSTVDIAEKGAFKEFYEDFKKQREREEAERLARANSKAAHIFGTNFTAQGWVPVSAKEPETTPSPPSPAKKPQESVPVSGTTQPPQKPNLPQKPNSRVSERPATSGINWAGTPQVNFTDTRSAGRKPHKNFGTEAPPTKN